MNDLGAVRLANAILQRSVIDFRVYARKYNKAKERLANFKGKEKEREKIERILFISQKEMYDVIAFIMSDWFKILTQFNTPQEDCAKKLLKMVDISDYHIILDNNLYNKVFYDSRTGVRP